MAFRVEITGMMELFQKMDKLGEKGKQAASLALFEGARVVADAVSQAVQGIATEPFKYAKNGRKRKPSPEEKAAITGSAHGVSRFRKKLHSVDTSVGFNQSDYADVSFNHMNSNARTNYKAKYFKGYANMTTSTLKAAGVYERGLQNRKPVGAIANAINSGTSFMEKQPFMRKAFSQSKGRAMAAIEEGLKSRLEEMSEI